MKSITNFKISETIGNAISNGLRLAIPVGELTVSKWAENYRFVPPERSANPGRWSNDLVPFLVGIMDAVTNPAISKITLMKSSQIAGTEFLNNVAGYYIHIDPSAIMYLAENELKAQAWMKECFSPMVRDTPVLKSLIAEPKERDSSSTLQIKTFPGGNLVTAWATSPATLSSRPRRIVLMDECDAFVPTKEGDPIKLAEARTKTFTHSKKLIYCSSPRDKETSTIEPLYESSDKRKYFVPCPHCEEKQILEWKNVRWDENDAENAYYVCEHCGAIIEEDEKPWMIANGEWIAENATKNHAGFWINELYSPFSTWGEMACDFLDSKSKPEQLKVFTNTRLAQTWEIDGEKIEYADIQFHQEEYDAEIPDGVKILTAGIDVQDDRIELEVVGWGDDFESWSIDYKVFWGSPGDKETWKDIKNYLARDFFDAEENALTIKAACIDSGGHFTDEVYSFARSNVRRRYFAIKGGNISGLPIISKPRLVGKPRVKLFTIGTDAAKDTVFSYLKLTETGPGYCHFPVHYEESYFKQLCAEKRVKKFVGGKAKSTWIKITASARNEAFDCRIYAFAAVKILNPDFRSIERHRKKIAVEENLQLEKPEKPQKQRKFAKQVKGLKNFKSSGFLNNWRR